MILLKKIFLIILSVLVVIVIAGFFLPSKFSVERSILIKADARIIFDYINDLEKNGLWSPWNEEDPSSKIIFGPVKKGRGAWYTWKGDKTGEGKLEIVESREYTFIKTELTFGKSQKAEGYFKLEQAGDSVKLTQGFSEDAG